MLISILAGSAVMGMMIHEIMITAWDFAPELTGYRPFMLLILPLIWIATLTLLTLLSYKIFKKTKKGYKYPPAAIIGLSIVASVIFGSIMYNVSLANMVDGLMSDTLSPYAGLRHKIDQIWDQPGEGFIGGEVLAIAEDGTVTIQSHNDGEWTLMVPAEFMDDLGEGDKIVATGTRESEEEQTFQVERLRSHSSHKGFPFGKDKGEGKEGREEGRK